MHLYKTCTRYIPKYVNILYKNHTITVYYSFNIYYWLPIRLTCACIGMCMYFYSLTHAHITPMYQTYIIWPCTTIPVVFFFLDILHSKTWEHLFTFDQQYRSDIKLSTLMVTSFSTSHVCIFHVVKPIWFCIFFVWCSVITQASPIFVYLFCVRQSCVVRFRVGNFFFPLVSFV